MPPPITHLCTNFEGKVTHPCITVYEVRPIPVPWCTIFDHPYMYLLEKFTHEGTRIKLKLQPIAVLQRNSEILILELPGNTNLLKLGTNETGPLPLCTFSVMGLSMCSSIFSESSPVRSKSGIINELSGFQNSVPTVRWSYTSSSWHVHTGHAYCICIPAMHIAFAL